MTEGANTIKAIGANRKYIHYSFNYTNGKNNSNLTNENTECITNELRSVARLVR